MKNIAFFVFFIVLSLVYASIQAKELRTTTTIQGKIIDKDSGESLAGALISIEGSDIKVYSDLDGNFQIDLNNLEIEVPQLRVSMISYHDLIIKSDLNSTSQFLEFKLNPLL